MTAAVVHIIGLDVQVGPVRRQRCAWCGALLVEDDFTRMAWTLNPDGSDPGPPPPWPIFEALEVDGGLRRVVPREEWPASDEPGEKRLPDGCCALLDHEVTR